AVDDVAAECRQSYTISSFIIRGAWLGELASHTTHLDHGHGRAIGQHHSHLQDGTNTRGDLICGCVGKGFGAVAALEQKGLALCGCGEAFTQYVDFAGKYQWRTRTQFVDGGLIILVLAPSWLLGNWKFTPQI